MYNCVKWVYICVIVGFDFIGKCCFWNIGTMFSQRGEVCNGCVFYERENVILSWVTVVLIICQTDFHDWMQKNNTGVLWHEHQSVGTLWE